MIVSVFSPTRSLPTIRSVYTSSFRAADSSLGVGEGDAVGVALGTAVAPAGDDGAAETSGVAVV